MRIQNYHKTNVWTFPHKLAQCMHNLQHKLLGDDFSMHLHHSQTQPERKKKKKSGF